MAIIKIAAQNNSPSLIWWAERLSVALKRAGDPSKIIWGGESRDDGRDGESPDRLCEEIGEEGFSITNTGGRLDVAGRDEAGLCYALDELTRRVAGGNTLDTIQSMAKTPRFHFRAVKFNLPWSCYRSNISVTIHKDTVRDLSFWDEFLDMMAEHRFNVLTLWNVHPYPFMTRSKTYPLACGLTDSELDSWRAFWTGLFYRCKQRCIRPFIMSMNVLVSEEFRKHYDAKAYNDAIHWGPSYLTPDVENYLRESITQVIDEYPDLAGIGTSLGEHMNGVTPEEREAFRERVYSEAVRRASRSVEIIWRAPFSDNTNSRVTREAIEKADLPDSGHPIWVEIKYNFSHGYSSPKLLAAHGVTRQSAGGADKVRELLKDYWEPEPEKYKMALMVRNEDFFVLRWAEPDYVRAHIAENDKSYVGGYFIGSEGLIPAKEYAHCPDHPHLTWRYAFQKNRLYYMIWGRLLFDPSTPDSEFERDIDMRYGAAGVNAAGVGAALFAAYKHACGMPMALATFHSATWDFSLYSEGFLSTKFDAHMFTDWDFNGYAPGRSFITIENLVKCQPLDPNWLSAREYATQLVYGGKADAKVTPVDVAEKLEAGADAAEAALASLPSSAGFASGNSVQAGVSPIADISSIADVSPIAGVSSISGVSPELECEKDDIRAWIALNRYFACKLRAAVALAVFMQNHDMGKREEAVRWLDEPNAKSHWKRLVEITDSHYRQMPLVVLGTQPFHWRLFTSEVDADIEYAAGRHTPAIEL